MATETGTKLQEMVDNIANELKAVYDGEMLADEYEAEKMGVEEGDPISLWDYFLNDESILDIDYMVAYDKKTLKGVRLLVAFGGPNIYINTMNNAVEGYWWGDSVKAWIPHEIAEEITDVFQEFWAIG